MIPYKLHDDKFINLVLVKYVDRLEAGDVKIVFMDGEELVIQKDFDGLLADFHYCVKEYLA